MINNSQEKYKGGCQDQWSLRNLDGCKPVAYRRCDLARNHKLQLVPEIIHKYALKLESYEAVSGEIGKVISLFPVEILIPKTPDIYNSTRR